MFRRSDTSCNCRKVMILSNLHRSAGICKFISSYFIKYKVFLPHISMYSTKLNDFIKKPLHFIDGNRCEPEDNSRSIDIIEPSTGKCVGRAKQADALTVEKAVKNSSAAFQKWSKYSSTERSKVLLAAARVLKTRVNEISEIEVLNNGKPIWEAKVDVYGCVDTLEYFGRITAALTGEFINLSDHSFGYTVHEPLGVVAGIGAWNYPFQIATWKSAPAIACGNSVIYKPSEFTPISALLLADVYKEAGLPDGVFNIIQGDGNVGQMLCEHSGVSKVSLTGSVPVGVKVLQSCAKDLKHVTLELGGKSPLIIFEDCDIENAVKGTIVANFLSQGQVCSNGTRVFIHESIWDEFVGKLVERTHSMKIGDPMDENTRVGASINKQHFHKVYNYIKEAEEQGAKVLCGGKRVILEGHLSGGYYLSPCILSDVTDDMKVAKEEIFGPVLCLFKFSSEEEVLKRANDTPYGLAAGLFTNNLTRAHKVASQLEAGMIWINNYNLTPSELPFGGVKMSGLGRENGKHMLDYYTNVKSVYVEMGNVDCPF